VYHVLIAIRKTGFGDLQQNLLTIASYYPYPGNEAKTHCDMITSQLILIRQIVLVVKFPTHKLL